MKTLTVRLTERLAAEIEAESRERKISKSEVVREWLERAPRRQRRTPPSFEAIADLIGSMDGLPADLSACYKHYLRTTAMAGGGPVDAAAVYSDPSLCRGERRSPFRLQPQSPQS